MFPHLYVGLPDVLFPSGLLIKIFGSAPTP